VTDTDRQRAEAKAFIEETAARKLARRRATARLGIGEKFRILEELHEAERDISAIRAAARTLAPRRDKWRSRGNRRKRDPAAPSGPLVRSHYNLKLETLVHEK
jgi:hypothetical protein